MATMAQLLADRQRQLVDLRTKTGCTRGSDLGNNSSSSSSAHAGSNGDLGGAVNAVLANPAVNEVSMADRLYRRIGLGDNPLKRKALFARIQRLWQHNRELVEQLVSESWAQAAGARRRDRYFCRAIVCKLAEAGLDRSAAGGLGHEPI